jgi:tetratricopeptide (TPR) repeat protein
MKLFIICVGILIIGIVVYWFSSKLTKGTKKRNRKNIHGNAIAIALVVVTLLLGWVFSQIYESVSAPDSQCAAYHAAPSYPPMKPVTAMDYFVQGNFDYDTGNCAKAIADYSQSIERNPKYPQAYNNRAYTLMRMRNFGAAVSDLDKAIELKPDYIHALMNRGDIHNYYYALDRQSALLDYEKVISYGGMNGTNVCGHAFLARHNGWNIGTLLSLPRLIGGACE